MLSLRLHLTSELKLADERLRELLNQTHGMLHDIHPTVDTGGRKIINLIGTHDKACQAFFGCFSYLFSYPNKGKAPPTIFLSVLSVGIAAITISLSVFIDATTLV